MSVITNAYPITIKRDRLYLHSVSILVTTDNNKIFSLSEGFTGKKMVRKLLCRRIVKSIMADKDIFAYEGENLLVTTFQVKDVNQEISLESFENCPDSLKKFKAAVIVELLRDVDPSDTSIENLPSMLEMVLSSHALTNGYRKVGRGKYISREVKDNGCHILTQGYSISVKPVEAGGFAAFIDPRVFVSFPQRSVAAAVSILVKKCRNVPTIDELKRMKFYDDELQLMSSYVRGALVTAIEGSDVTYTAIQCKYIDLEKETVATKDGTMLLKDTWRFKKSELSRWPVLVVKTRTGDLKLPMDVIEFCECQAIDSKNPAFNSKETVMEPGERENRLKKLIESMKIFGRNEWLEEFGMEVGDRLRPAFHRVSAPEISFSQKSAQMDMAKRKWTIRGFKYDRGGRADVFVILIVGGVDDVKLAEQFGEWMYNECKNMGMNVPEKEKVIMRNFKQFNKGWVEDIFKRTKEEVGSQKYLVYIDAKRIKSHDFLKDMEKKYEVITEHVTLEIAKSVVQSRQRVTLQNIINKANKKLGGKNYSVNPKTSENLSADQWTQFISSTMIIGSDVCRPNTYFATVGLCSNALTSDPEYFTGDYRFQKPRQENIDSCILREYVEHVLEQYKMAHDRFPEKILYLRDGVADNQHTLVHNEVDVMRSTAQTLGIHLQITAIVILKDHNCRILSSDFKNPLAGTVVNKGIVDPKQDQFYLQSHTPLKGTGKSPLFKILVNDEKLAKEHIEELVNNLAFEFEICSSPVSCPTPVFIAHEMAKRGNNLQREHEHENLGIDQLTARLALKGTLLEKVRVNA